jgi:hypothetical protein
VLVDWSGMVLDGKEIPFDVERLADICTVDEIFELFHGTLIGRVSFEDKKKSE